MENLLRVIRGGCGSGNNPTPSQFIGSPKTQILNKLTSAHAVGSNCEANKHSLLSSLTGFINVAKSSSVSQPEDNLGVTPPTEIVTKIE